MCLKEMGEQIAGRQIEIVATEFSTQVLEKAKAGIFSQFEVQRGLPIQLLIKYFDKIGDAWQINPDVRAMVQFRPFNLLHEFTQLGPFDLVFCRNVLIYFDQETKSRVLDRIARIMEHDGYLVLGAAETVVGLTDSFKPLPDRRGVYAPSATAKARTACDARPALRLATAR
jgi:chemotaxis protein methyltransferase CheR